LRVKLTPTLTIKRRRAWLPLRVILLSPSIVVSAEMVLVELRAIVCVPQLKVTAPPPTRRLEKSESLVQLVTCPPARAGAAAERVMRRRMERAMIGAANEKRAVGFYMGYLSAERERAMPGELYVILYLC
jgi:hypothetical protein